MKYERDRKTVLVTVAAILFILVLAPFLSGCEDIDSSKLRGSWKNLRNEENYIFVYTFLKDDKLSIRIFSGDAKNLQKDSPVWGAFGTDRVEDDLLVINVQYTSSNNEPYRKKYKITSLTDTTLKLVNTGTANELSCTRLDYVIGEKD